VKRAALQIDKTPRMVIQSNPTTLFRYHFQVTNFFTKQLEWGDLNVGGTHGGLGHAGNY